MTEEEAKTKWCFHFIASHTDPRTPPSQIEREAGETSPFRHHCIASACMAWREQWTVRRAKEWASLSQSAKSLLESHGITTIEALAEVDLTDLFNSRGRRSEIKTVDHIARFLALHGHAPKNWPRVTLAEGAAKSGYCGLAGRP